jgi:hypothetical protein
VNGPTFHAKFGGSSVRPVPSAQPVYRDLFAQYVRRDDSNGCHLWTGRTDSDGQPRFKFQRVIYSARRVALAWWLDDDLADVEIVRPRCGVKACVNPHHMDYSLPRVMLPPTVAMERKRSADDKS